MELHVCISQVRMRQKLWYQKGLSRLSRPNCTNIFLNKDEYSYLPVLQSVAFYYNRTYHRTIGMTPANSNFNTKEELRLSTYFAQTPGSHKPRIKHMSFKYKIDDYVRISDLKTVFTHAYDETYSGEVFRIYKRYQIETLSIYRL